MLKKILYILLFFFCFSCENQNEVEAEIEKIDVDFELKRFDERIAEAEAKDLPNLKKEFPYLFPKRYPDSLWIEKFSDSIQIELNTEVAKAFPNFEKQKDKLHELFQHIKYYFPQFEAPTVVTITSEVDYRNKVIATDSLLLISLDTYLGEDHKFYVGIQDFFSKNFKASQIVPDVAEAYAEKFVPKPESRTFLGSMIYYGKILYLKEKFIPGAANYEKIGYTKEELEWAQASEEEVWRYFVENELLFSTNPQLDERFLLPAPFSKFYLKLDSESPDRLGRYIGWQIVKKYAEETDAELKQLLATDAQTIFEKANYKPSK